MRSPHDILSLLRVVAQTDCLVIGGQAVNLWSERYQKPEPPWSELQPFTSIDLDLLGSRRDVLAVAELLRAKPQLPGPDANTVNAGTLLVPSDDGGFEIDVVHTANGINTQEAGETAPTLAFRDVRLRVLHPVLCIESKTVNLATLPQDAGYRQDLKHLRLSIANAREFLAELTLEGRNPAALLRWAKRLRRAATHQLGLDAARRHSVNFQQAIPQALWEQTTGPLADFIQTEWAAWAEEVSRKLAEEREVERWLRNLQAKDPKDSAS
ncbi:MAG: hypothetical protein HZA90_11970 [Verrucomicrobia bacterium]|nr:hypothetical protein [Verrucomicrobiota bacterium]